MPLASIGGIGRPLMTEPTSAKLRGPVGEGRQFMIGYELLSEPQRDIAAETAPERLRASILGATSSPVPVAELKEGSPPCSD